MQLIEQVDNALTHEDIQGAWAPSMHIQQEAVMQLGQVGVSVMELVAEAMRFTWPEIEFTLEEEQALCIRERLLPRQPATRGSQQPWCMIRSLCTA